MQTQTKDLWRFFAKVDATGDCWQWLASCDRKGYGQFHSAGTTRKAHVWLMEVLYGPLPGRLMHDHLCRNRGCVNPLHLERVTNRENVLRGQTVAARNVAKTHCPQGHPYDVANTRVTAITSRYPGNRSCRTCHRTQEKANYYRRKAQRAQG